MSVDVSERVLEGYRLARVTEDAPGFITVHEGTAAADGERVSVRAFPIPSDRRARKAFRRAARARVDSAHPGLVPAREVVEHDGLLYLVTDAHSGSALSERVARAPLAPRVALRAFEPVASALSEVQWLADAILTSSQIVLADSDGGHAILLDPAKGVSLAETGWPWVHPYPQSAPPELGRGEHLGGRSVVYSLGCILFECVSGSPPFQGDWLALIEAHSAEEIPRASERRPDLGPALDAVLARAMAKDPNERFASAADLVRAAAAALEDGAGDDADRTSKPAAGPPPVVAVERPLVEERQPEPVAEAAIAGEKPAAYERDTNAEQLRETDGNSPVEAKSPSLTGAVPMATEPVSTEPRHDVDPPPQPGPALVASPPTDAEPAASSVRRGPSDPRRPHDTDERGRRPRARRPLRMAALAGVVAVTAAVAGYLIGESDTSTPAPDVAAGGAASLELPADWQRGNPRGVLTGVPLSGTLAARPQGARQTGIVAGRTESTTKDFLPSGLTPSPGVDAEPVRLGRYDAYRHRGLRAGRSGPQVTAYSIPAEGGAAVVACYATAAAAPAFMPTCERVASTVELRGARPMRLTAVRTERRRLSETVAKLRTSRSASRRRLAAARTPGRQARQARALRGAYLDARRSFAKLDAAVEPPGWKAQVLTQVRRVERAYARLASASARGARSRYATARRSVRRSEARLARLLAGAATSR